MIHYKPKRLIFIPKSFAKANLEQIPTVFLCRQYYYLYIYSHGLGLPRSLTMTFPSKHLCNSSLLMRLICVSQRCYFSMVLQH